MSIEAEMDAFYAQVDEDLLRDLKKTNPYAYPHAREEHLKNCRERVRWSLRRVRKEVAK